MDIGKSKRLRESQRKYAEKLIAKINKECDTFDGSKEKNEVLLGLKKSLEEKALAINKLDESILESSKEKDFDKEIEDSGEFSEAVFNSVARIETCIQHAVGADSSTSIQGQDKAQNTKKSTPKLPKLALKTFDGDPTDWQPFWDCFKTSVYDYSELSDIDKFNYLKGCLSGQAAKSIEGIPLTSENLENAVEILKDRFAQPQILISSYMNKLLQLSNVESVTNVTKLRELYDQLEINIRSLRTMGVQSETYGMLLIPIVMDKIPKEISLEINRKLDKNDSLDVDKVLTLIKTEVEARERCLKTRVTIEPQDYQRKNDKQETRRKSEFNSTCSTLYTGNRNIVYCSFCSKNHPSLNCNVVTDPASRKAALRRKGRCFICLKSGHLASQCQSQHNCHKCRGRHHTAICESQNNKNNEATHNTMENKSQQSTASNSRTQNQSHPTQSRKTTNLLVGDNTSILLQTAKAIIRNPGTNCTVNARLIFDTGSQRSYVTTNLRNVLDLPTVTSSNLLIKAFGEGSNQSMRCDHVQFAVKTLEGSDIYVSAYCVPVICSPVANQAINVAVDLHDHLYGLQLAYECDGVQDLDIDILIGADFYWCFANGDVRRGDVGPTAINTKIGWTLSGPVDSNRQVNQDDTTNLLSTHVLRIDASSFGNNDTVLETPPSPQFWDIEMIGTGMLKENKSETKEPIQNIEFKEGIYQVKLPFIDGHSIIPDNHSTSVKRLQSLITRLRKEPETLKHYDEVIKDQIEKGVVERVTVSSEEEDVGHIHYLPHREVKRSDRPTTQLRVVYDASSKGPQNIGPSLNDCLYTGQSLTPLLFDILLRFRTHRLAITADIEKAFLNISIAPEHRNFLRFLWLNNIEDDDPTLEVFRFTRLVFGLTSSPYILNATIRHHLEQYVQQDPEFVEEVLNSLYVDDYTSGADDFGSASEMAIKLKQRMLEGGFNMRKFTSNSTELIQELQKNELFSKSVNPTDTNTECQMLGLNWNTHEDVIAIKLDKVTEDLLDSTQLTKRTFLSTVAKFYDPLGIVSPVVLSMKILFQEVCKRQFNWDEPLPDDVVNNFKLMIRDLSKTKVVTFNRCCIDPAIPKEEIITAQLHAFGDASEKAYGATVYLRIEYASGVYCSLIASKTRVAPMNEQTIPRLELQASLVTARLANRIKNSLEGVLAIDELVLWSDSVVVLHWIKNGTKKQKQYVQNRIKEIRELTRPEWWRYCPTQDNPADLASRGTLASQLVKNDKWFKGPQFLAKTVEFWPSQDVIVTSKELIEEENVMTGTREPITVNLSTAKEPGAQPEWFLPIERYSDYQRILRITAYVIRFISNLRRKKLKQPIIKEALSIQELNDAEKIWMRVIQYSIRLSSEKFRQLQTSLDLFMDKDGIVRCKGRIENASVPYDTKHPILLSSEHYLTNLIIRDCHENVKHNGVKETLTELRKRFWIVKGRQVVKKCLSKCVTCKRIQGTPYRTPSPPSLPSFRLSDDFAFTRIGIDFAGPVYVKDIYTSGQLNKAYIVLYTCASSRAVHLDLVPDLSAESFVRSLKRFIGRRGIPVFILSDNGKTFKDKKLKRFVCEKNIEWKYNVERAPWWGGFFERLVQSVKRPLRKQFHNAKLTYEEFLTALIEVEGVLNSRPLTYVYDEIDEVLTPSHLVIGRRLMSQPDRSYVFSDDRVVDGSKKFSKRSLYLQKLLDQFWIRWQKEYLTELREHYRYKQRGTESSKAEEGDIVSIYQEKTPRQTWKIGRITRLLEGRDGKNRAAIVRTTTREGKPVELKRPLTKLYPIEVQDKNSEGKSVRRDEQVPKITFVDDKDINTVITR